ENVSNVLVNSNRVGCSYKKFLACYPKEYDGKGGDVVLTQWIEKIESVHDMSSGSIDQKVKYTGGSFVRKSLTCWNSQIRTLSQKVTASMSWNDFKFMMIEKFCPSHEMKKLETELWNHAMVGAGHAVYTDRFYELAKLVPHIVTDIFMSSASSAVTYTSVYTNYEPRKVFWGANEELSDGGSPQVIMYVYNGLPMQPVAPPSPDYIPGPKEPQTPPVPQDEDEHEPMFIQPHDPEYVLEPMYPEYIPLEDEHVLPAEEQPLPPIDLPTAKSSGYLAESDPEEDPEEYEDDETEDGLVDYAIDGGDDADDDDGESFGMTLMMSIRMRRRST
nr:reverse transcriptase domain-containing protein [Tanacetum cinerariifolium]